MSKLWRGVSAMVALGLAGTAEADTILFEDFEDATVAYAANPADDLSDIGNNDYYGLVQTSSLPSNVNYSNVQGSGVFAAQDTDGVPGSGSTFSVTLTWSSIDIASFTNLDLSWFIAEDDASDGTEDWDSTTSVRIDVQIDGGGFDQVFGIEAEDNTGNVAPRVDTNFDGLGNGVEITSSFAQFNTSIGDGSVLDIRLVIEDLDTSEEDIAFDSLLLTGDPTSVAVPLPGSLVLFAPALALLGFAGRRRAG